MHRQSHILHGLVLGSTLYGEADKLITIFTLEEGKIIALAKGVRKPSSRKRGSLEVFSEITLQVTNSKTLPLITEVNLKEFHDSLRIDLKKAAVAYFFCEVTKRITAEHVPHSEIYDLLTRHLTELESTDNIRKSRTAFTWAILELTGFIVQKNDEVDPQKILEEVLERNLGSVRIGRMLQ